MDNFEPRIYSASSSCKKDYGWSRLWQSTASIFILLDSPDPATVDSIDFYFSPCFLRIILIHALLLNYYHKLYRWTDSSIIHIDNDYAGSLPKPGIVSSTLRFHQSSVFFSVLEFSYPDFFFLIRHTFPLRVVIHFSFSGFGVLERTGACCIVLGGGQ